MQSTDLAQSSNHHSHSSPNRIRNGSSGVDVTSHDESSSSNQEVPYYMTELTQKENIVTTDLVSEVTLPIIESDMPSFDDNAMYSKFKDFINEEKITQLIGKISVP